MVLKAKTAGVVHIVCNHNYLSWQKNIKKSYTVDTNLYDFQYFHFLSIFHSVFVVTNSPFGRLKRLNWEASLLRPTHGVPLLACETWGPRATRSFKLYIYTPEKKPAYPSKTLFILHVFLNDSKASRFKSVPMPEKVQAFQPYVFDSWRCTRRDVAVNVPTTGHAREHFLEQVACCTHPGKQPLARSTI